MAVTHRYIIFLLYVSLVLLSQARTSFTQNILKNWSDEFEKYTV